MVDFEQLSAAFDAVFAELTDAIIDGQAQALPDARMTEINLTWAETFSIGTLDVRRHRHMNGGARSTLSIVRDG